jgi:hypothetical protein
MSSEKTSLLFYFKYNEGWTTSNSQYVVDYSGRGLDGVFNYYSADSRLDTSAIDESGLVKTKEKSDTIWLDKNLNFNLFSPALQTYFEQKIEAATEYDENNKHALWKKFPSWIYDEEGDLGTQNFKKLVQLMSVYFDDLYNKIKEISSLKHQKHTADLDSIYPFYDKIISSTGFDVTDLFSGVDGIENLSSRNDTYIFEDKIYKVKNKIYQNIYNNLAYILKSKGTEKSIKSLLHSYGVDENLVKINLYADKSVFNAVETKTAEKIIRKKTVSLKNDQYITINGLGLVTGTLELQAFLPVSTESKISLLSTNAVSVFLKSVADGGMAFELSSSSESIETDSFKVLDNQLPWNISLRSDDTKYYLTATKYTTGEYYESFNAFLNLTDDITDVTIGSSNAVSTDIRATDVALWNFVLADETLLEHAKDITNYGIPDPQTIPDKGVFYWDFEKNTAPDGYGQIIVYDIFNNNSGIGYGFTEGDLSFVKKEYVKTYKKLNFDTIESLETIQTLDEDDHFARSLNKKPEKVALFIENSMYQIISEEMINMFSNIGDYIFAFSEHSNAYANEYVNLKKIKNYFFSKVVNTPDIERYLEFYKWLDSSLGYLIDQIKPENANTHSGLKISIENHMLERNKYQYALPLMIDTKKNFDVNLVSTAVTDSLISASAGIDALGEARIGEHEEDGRKTNTTIKNILNKNFQKNYEVLNTAGKTLNNRGDKENKTVFRNKFSSADGLTDLSDTEEYSIYSSLLNKSLDMRKDLNIAESEPLGTQTISETQGIEQADNNFIQRAIPYSNNNFSAYGYNNYNIIPSLNIVKQRSGNNIYSSNQSYREPPVEWIPPAEHNIRVANALEDLSVLSSYSSKFKRFANDDLESKLFGANKIDVNDTFIKKIENVLTSSLLVNSSTRLDTVYPRKEYHGLYDIRNKSNYEQGIDLITIPFGMAFLYVWGDNSYNRNSGLIRSFWNSDLEKRKRLDRVPTMPAGAINCLNYPNNISAPEEYILRSSIVSTSTIPSDVPSKGTHIGTKTYIYDIDNPQNPHRSIAQYFIPLETKIKLRYFTSIYALDANNNTNIFKNSFDKLEIDFLDDSTYGDIGPFGHQELFPFTRGKINTKNPINNNLFVQRIQPKPQFIFNNFITITDLGEISGLSYASAPYMNPVTARILLNDSYQGAVDSRITASYNSYASFYENLKHISKNYSIIPEYVMSNILGDITGSSESLDLSLNLRGYNDNVQLSDSEIYKFKININKFIDKKTNEFVIRLSGIKKMLPYAGFYPAERTKQIARYFQEEYDFNNLKVTNGSSKHGAQTLIQPFFAPGILFNSIKSGLAVSYPVLASNTLLGSEEIYSSVLKRIYTDSSVNTPYPLNNPNCNSVDCTVEFKIDSSIAVKKITNILPFEAILDPKSSLKSLLGRNLYYLDPTRYISFFSNTISELEEIKPELLYPSIDIDSIENGQNTLYRYAINNFISEVPNFFLKNNELTYFESLGEKNFKLSENGKKYVMNLRISKSQNFSMFNSASNDVPVTSLFGPPCQAYYSGKDHTGTVSDEIYLPYAPPYLRDGGKDTYIKFEYTGNGEKFTADQINRISINRIQWGSDHSTENPLNITYYHAMNLDSCCRLLDLVESPLVTTDAITGQEISQTTTSTPNRKWVIQTKFESPLINYINEKKEPSIAKEIVLDGAVLAEYVNEYNNVLPNNFYASNAIPITLQVTSSQINGIWNRLGAVPSDNNSVQLTLEDTDGVNAEETGSLMDLVGFKKESKSIGTIADKKIISEGMLLLPYSTSVNAENNSLFKKVQSGYLKDKYLIKIDPETIKTILGFDYRTKTIKEIEYIFFRNKNLNYNNSIVKLIKNMLEYNIPPYLNWLDNSNNLEPFVFYVAEFTHELDKDDLAKIWQGTLPKIGFTPEEQTLEIRHKFSPLEVLSEEVRQYLTNDSLDGIVFKVKRKANREYNSIIKKNEDTRYTDIPWNTFNWPYDHFSLVELLNIQAGEGYTSDTLSTEPTLVNTDIQFRVLSDEIEQIKNREIKIPDVFKGNKS